MSTYRDPAQLRQRPTQIVLGANGSPSSLIAADVAASLAARFGADLHVLVAYQPMSARQCRQYAAQLGPLAYQLTGSHPAEDDAREAVGRAAHYGVSASFETAEGCAATELRRAARKRRADLLVVADGSAHGLGRLVSGRVPRKLSRHAPCDVLLVNTRRAAKKQPAGNLPRRSSATQPSPPNGRIAVSSRTRLL